MSFIQNIAAVFDKFSGCYFVDLIIMQVQNSTALHLMRRFEPKCDNYYLCLFSNIQLFRSFIRLQEKWIPKERVLVLNFCRTNWNRFLPTSFYPVTVSIFNKRPIFKYIMRQFYIQIYPSTWGFYFCQFLADLNQFLLLASFVSASRRSNPEETFVHCLSKQKLAIKLAGPPPPGIWPARGMKRV